MKTTQEYRREVERKLEQVKTSPDGAVLVLAFLACGIELPKCIEMAHELLFPTTLQ